MTSRDPSRHPRARPLSSLTLPPPDTQHLSTLKRKYSLDHHGDCQQYSWTLQSQHAATEVTSRDEEVPPPPPPQEAKKETPAGVEERHSGPLAGRESTDKCKRKVLKKQTSFESIGCDDNYFYDFFDRNGRPPTPTTSEDPPPPVSATASNSDEIVNDASVTENRVDNRGASCKLRRNVNSVRPKSWLTTGATRPEESRRVRRRQTDPCGKDFLSNYERALSSLLYQPYDCRTEGPSASTTFDDSDVSYWLGPNPKRWRERERRSVGECCSYQNESPNSSSSSLSSSNSSLEEYKPWGSSKDPSSSSIRALLAERRSGNTAESTDLDPSFALSPPGALAATGYTERERVQSAARHGREMLVSVTECDTRGSQSNLLTATASATCEEGVSVSCYRAVPAQVSSVPTIACNNVSNVRIVQTTAPRTFTSTEAQTDDVIVDQIRAPGRDQRRRERRERRHQRRLHQTPDPLWHPPISEPMVDRLPDILNSHLPPPYTTLPVGLPPPPPPGHISLPAHPPPLPPPIAVTAVPGSPPPQAGGLRFPFAIVPPGRRRTPHYTPDDEPKSCCGLAVSQTLSIRWFIILIFLVGICCAAVGTILGAMKATGREHLTVSLLMIGVGIVLVAVSGVAWRLTSQDAPSCRAMLGLGGDDAGGEPNRRFVPRLPPSYGRPHHPYAAMMYPEFQYRAPPPSYQASMQEYRLRLLLLDRHSGAPGNGVSPPPTYRSQPSSLLRAPLGLRGREMHTPSQSEYSRPPSYRSRTSSRPDPASTHSREPSGSDTGQAVNVITVHPHIIKLAPSPPLPSKEGKDANLVTIVQTTSESSGPVIVTISGQQSVAADPDPGHCHDSEMEILAHL